MPRPKNVSLDPVPMNVDMSNNGIPYYPYMVPSSGSSGFNVGSLLSGVPGLLGAGLSLLGGWINRRHSEKMADKQFQQSIYLQDKQNAYNSPSAQMERLRAAGLNPNLIYTGNANMPSASASPAQQPNTQAIDTQGILQSISMVMQGMLESKKLDVQREMQQEQINASTNTQTRQFQHDTEQKAIDREVQQEQFNASMDFQERKQVQDNLLAWSRLDYDQQMGRLRYNLDSLNSAVSRRLGNANAFSREIQNDIDGALKDARLILEKGRLLFEDQKLDVEKFSYQLFDSPRILTKYEILDLLISNGQFQNRTLSELTEEAQYYYDLQYSIKSTDFFKSLVSAYQSEFDYDVRVFTSLMGLLSSSSGGVAAALLSKLLLKK